MTTSGTSRESSSLLASRARRRLYVTGARLWHRKAVEQRFRELSLPIERVDAREGWCGFELRRV